MKTATALIICALAVAANAATFSPPSPPLTVVSYDSLVEELTAAIITKYQSGVSTLDSLSTSWSSSLNQLTEQLAAGYAAYSTQFCTAPEFDIGGKVPAEFTGPGFSLTFSTGNCTFNETALIVDGKKELDCVEPSMVFEKTPATFTSKHVNPPTFAAKECVLSKTFGTSSSKVLMTFDGSSTVNSTDLTAQITAEIKALLSQLATAGSGPN